MLTESSPLPPLPPLPPIRRPRPRDGARALSPRPDQDGLPLIAAAYIRVSTLAQMDGHSPEVQRAGVLTLARADGNILTDDMIFQDHESGTKVTRAHYQRLLARIAAGDVQILYVYCFDRWGRDGVEWIARAQELRRQHIPFVSVQEGREEGGVMTFFRGGLYQWYSEQLGKKVIEPKRAAARAGQHQGPTPFGYRRVYAEWDGTRRADGKRRRPPATMLVDEPAAWVVRALFDRYDAGGWSTGRLAHWLNADPDVPRPTTTAQWSRERVASLLRNATYAGLVQYDARPQGRYARADRGTAFYAHGRHPALVDLAVWARVQERLETNAPRPGRSIVERMGALGLGLLVCAGCGGPMIAHYNDPAKAKGQYLCGHRRRGFVASAARPDTFTPCATPGYRMDLAHDALLAALGRLVGRPWSEQDIARLGADDAGSRRATDTAALRRALGEERERLRRHARALVDLSADAPTGGADAESLAAFRDVGREIGARIAGLEGQIAQAEAVRAPMADLRALHAAILGADMAAALARVDPAHNPPQYAAVRALVLRLVESAVVVERRPTSHARWLRVDVQWTPPMQTLMEAHQITLTEAPAPPQMLSRVEAHRGYQRRYRERTRLAAITRPDR